MDFALAIATDTAGNVYVTGGSDGEVVDTNYDYATIKYDPAGNEQWTRRYATPGKRFEHAFGVAVDSSGNVYVTGWSGNSLPSIDDYLTVKYDAAGAEQWARRYNGPASYPYDDAFALALDRFGNVFVTGKSAGTDNSFDYVTVKYDPEGNERWVRRYGCSPEGYDGALALVTDEQGSVYVSGESDSTQARLKDIMTIKYDSAGSEQWRRRYPGPLYSGPYGYRYLATTIDPRGNIYVAAQQQRVRDDQVQLWRRRAMGKNLQWSGRVAGNRDSARRAGQRLCCRIRPGPAPKLLRRLRAGQVRLDRDTAVGWPVQWSR